MKLSLMRLLHLMYTASGHMLKWAQVDKYFVFGQQEKQRWGEERENKDKMDK